MKTVSLLLVLLLALAPAAQAAWPEPGGIVFANGFDYPTRHAGGANYLWYQLDLPSCEREPYGLVPNYSQPGVRATAQQQLVAMYNQGMRSLAIGIMFRDGPATGTLIDAGDPFQVFAAANNLELLLHDIHAAGFQRVLFRFFPEGSMSPTHARNGTYDPATLDLYWNLVQAMRARLVQSPLSYLIDLGVENAPADARSTQCLINHGGDTWKCPAHKQWSNAVRELWHRYRSAYGVADTVGFSFITTPDQIRNRVRHMKYVYDGKYPGAYPAYLAIDLYGLADRDPAGRLIEFAGMVNGYSADYGFQVDGYIISETWNNDPLVAEHLASAIAASGVDVLYLAEWPLDRGAACAGISVPPPYAFDMYHLYGF